MNNNTLISLVSLTFLLGILLYWLVINTLKEGKEALEEMRRDPK